MTIFLGNFPATRIDLLLSGSPINRVVGCNHTDLQEFMDCKKCSWENFNYKEKGETYEGECSQVSEQKMLEKK